MRKPLIVLALVGVFAGAGAAPALAGPTIPKNCHEWNALLHLDNVRNCDNNS